MKVGACAARDNTLPETFRCTFRTAAQLDPRSAGFFYLHPVQGLKMHLRTRHLFGPVGCV